MAIEASSAEGCLHALKSSADGESVEIVGYHQDQEIGRGQYRKFGPAGRIAGIETLATSGALVGFIEGALARREEERRQQIQTERATRLRLIACSCGHTIGYDQEDHCFAQPNGETTTICSACGQVLDLRQIMRRYQQQIDSLQEELQRKNEALYRVQRLT
jgi:hypothetical protein